MAIDETGGIRPFAVTHRLVLRLALPMMLAYLSTPLVGIVNTAVVGQLGSAALIGGIAVAAVIFDVIFSVFNFLRGATTGLTAQAFGAGDATEEQAILFRALVLAVICGLVPVILQWPLGRLAFGLMDVHGDVLSAARTYFTIRIWGSPLTLCNYAVLGWILGRGQSGRGLVLQTLLNGINIVLSLALVIGLGWGVAGAAWASLAAEAATLLAGLLLAFRQLDLAHRPALPRVLDGERLRRMMAVNGDMMIRSLSLLIVYAFFTRAGGHFGQTVLAANAVLMNLYMLGSYYLDGFANAAEQLSGRAVGAHYRPAFERVVKLTCLWGFGLVVPVAVLLYAAGPVLIDWIATAPEVRETARHYLVWAALAPVAAVLAFLMDGIFIGATWSRDMRNMMILSLAVFLIADGILTPRFGNHGLWIAFLIFLGARSLVFNWRMRVLLPRTFG